MYSCWSIQIFSSSVFIILKWYTSGKDHNKATFMFIVQLPNSKLSFPYYDRLPTQPAPVSQTSASEISILLGKCGGAVHR